MGKILLSSPTFISTTSSESICSTPQTSPRSHLVSVLATKTSTFRRPRLLALIFYTGLIGAILYISPKVIHRTSSYSTVQILGRQYRYLHETYTRVLPIIETYEPTKVGLEVLPPWNIHPLPLSSWRRWAELIDIHAPVIKNLLMPDKLPINVFPREIVLSENAPELKDLMFGMTTTAERATVISHVWSHWLNPNSKSSSKNKHQELPSCVILLPQSNFETTSADQISQADQLINTLHHERQLPSCKVINTIAPHTDRYEVRCFAILKEMYQIANSDGIDPKWYIIGDDDTVWVDERMLRRELSNYDHEGKWFLGSTSEAIAQLNTFGNIAYGGAGILISKGLFKEMVRIHDDCLEENKDVFGGDGMYTLCAAKAMGNNATKETVLTQVEALHQLDIPGDGTGIFQAGLPFLSFHHMWHGWTDAFAWDHPTSFHHDDNDLNQLLLLMKAASFLGGDNLFKRSIHGNGSQLVNLGFSITIFDTPLLPKDMSSIEYTWSYDDYKLRYPSRPKIIETDEIGTGGKRTYYISQINISDDGQSATFIHLDRWSNRMDLIWGEPHRNSKVRSKARWT
ncbi:hypothetical protein CROQUDRAFT_36799 [Cronartium quercuum f. sp. fusiforme G11]|uniref:Glycosyltransferase family 31 protein n=1 Tax=Cronartium quercuum f. sp. fusiforme G11 TaxID=708437 RepID=A0A9P6TGU6_9BASI|nr:hypothetical protein CROQUDRAFT_36799 [Cronartium quercuum f. sp. fusiforme G11]